MECPVARLDWLTIRTAVEPREGARWRGSAAGGRFVALDAPGLECRPFEVHGKWQIALSGEFFRRGESWRALVRDVWGWPPPPSKASRVDVALSQASGGKRCDIEGAAAWLAHRLSRQSGKVWSREWRSSPTGDLAYLFAGSGGSVAECRGRLVQLWRVYQRREVAGWGPLRLELERKCFDSTDSLEACVGVAGREFEGATGVRLEDEAVDGVSEGDGLDPRSEPAKLLRQAYGLCRLAELRAAGGARREQVEAGFSAIWSAVVGGVFDRMTGSERARSRRLELAAMKRDAAVARLPAAAYRRPSSPPGGDAPQLAKVIDMAEQVWWSGLFGPKV